MRTINKKDLKGNPTENGWYICQFIHASWSHYLDEEELKNGIFNEDYRINHYIPMLLYWEDNLWLKSPRGYEYVEEKYILDWMRVPDGYSEGSIRVNY